jgi:hypothetical protein
MLYLAERALVDVYCDHRQFSYATTKEKRRCFMPHADTKWAYASLIFGAIGLFFAVVGTRTGETWTRNGRVVRRAEDPIQFWWIVATCYLVGIAFITYFLCQVYDLFKLS